MRDKEILFLETALGTGKSRKTSELGSYKAEQVQKILSLKESDPDNFILQARRYIEYQVVLDFIEPDILNLPSNWNRNLWRDGALFYGDQVFDLMADALDLYKKLSHYFDNPEPEEFAQAIKDRTTQYLLTFPNMNNSDAEYIPRYLQLVRESLDNIEALPEYIQLRKKMPADWQSRGWDQRAYVFGKETVKYLRDALVLEGILSGLTEETVTLPAWQETNVPENISKAALALKNVMDPIDARLAVSKATKIAKNFSTAAFFAHTASDLDTDMRDVMIDRALHFGRASVHEYSMLPVIFDLQNDIEKIQHNLGIEQTGISPKTHTHLERLVRLSKNGTDISSIFSKGDLVSQFSQQALLGIPLLKDDVSLPEWSTMGGELELFGIQDSNYDYLDTTLALISPGMMRTVDATIRPTDNTKGMEVVSPIITNEFSGLLATTEVLKSMGGQADLPCAFHAHHGLSKIFEEKQLAVAKQVKLNYISIEDDLSFLDSGLTHYYKHVFRDNGSTLDESVKAVIAAPLMTDVMRITQPSGRRRARVNLQSVFEHGTMEFRQHPGTVEPSEVRGWFLFVSGLVDLSAQMIVQNGEPRMPQGRELDRLKQLVEKLRMDRSSALNWNVLPILQPASVQ